VSARRWAVVAVALLAADCKREENGGGPAGGPPGNGRFAFLTNNSSDFWNIAEKGVRRAEQDLGITAQVFRPLKTEVSEQQRFIEDILVQGFAGLAISPISPDAMTPLLDRVAARMPVICHDSDAAHSKRKVYVGTDNFQAGRAAGQAALAALGRAGIRKGKVAMFVGRIEMQNAIDRKRGIEDTLGKSGDLELLPVYLDHADRGKAKQNAEDALARHPDLVMAMGLWSYNGPCIAGAVRASSRPRKPLIIAFDEEEETLKAVEDGVIEATIVQKPYQFGYQSMRVLKELREGKQLPATVDTGITTVTKENLAAFWSELRALKQ
jgi:ribose transport system substrate-binding protein